MHETFMARKNILIIPPRLFGATAIAIMMVQLALIWTHVPWHDELQAVLLARDTNTLTQWYTNFRYEGHPPLWHLLLKFMLVFFDPPNALRAGVSLAALGTAWLIFLRSPFSPGMKLVLGLNYFLLFEYGTIARGYCLGVFFIFAAIAFRTRPIGWLFAALIPQGGAQMIVLPGFFAALMLWEKRWSWRGVGLCALSGVLALIWMTPASDHVTFLRGSLFMIRLARMLVNAGNIMLPMDIDGTLVGWTNPAHLSATALTGALMPALVWAASRQSLRSSLAATAFALLTCALTLAGYGLNLRHFGFIIVIIIACQWIDLERGLPHNRIAAIWFAILAISGIGAAVSALQAPFSASGMMADHVARTMEQDRLIIPIDMILGVEVSAYSDRSTYNVTNSCLQTFVQWKGPAFMASGQFVTPITDATEAATRQSLDVMKAAAARAGGRALVILGDDPSVTFHLVADDPALRFDRFFHVGGPRGLMDRYLYRLDVPPAPHPVPIPPCIR